MRIAAHGKLLGIRLPRRSALFVAGTLAIYSLFFLPKATSAQTPGLNMSGASNCVEADFDAYLQFLNGPADYYTIVIDKRNISGQSCIFDGNLPRPSFAPDRVPGDLPFELCTACEDRTPNGQYRTRAPITLDPGQIARQTFRWKTTPVNGSEHCLQPNWMSGPVLVDAHSLLKEDLFGYRGQSNKLGSNNRIRRRTNPSVPVDFG